MNDALVNKLIFWLLSALAVTMTAIGGAAANRLITQGDSIAIRMNILESQNSALTEGRIEMERRLTRIEDKLDAVRFRQH